ncbi:MAG TPA: DNA starvation/stationary phase protection protein [Phycisphaerales bacterium]|nr:DNA starvation/stationary phase protection protein [Phycisphaerales bacterium]
MKSSTITRDDRKHLKEPVSPSATGEVQGFDHVQRTTLALDATAARASVDSLNQLLADTITLRDLYKKHHWQASGPTFYMLHLLFDKHAGEQTRLIDLVAERIQVLGGVAIAMGADVAEATLIPRAPKGREDTAAQLARLLHAHEAILLEARAMARGTATAGDIGTDDIIVSDVIRTNELQVWFLAQHLP